MSAQMTAKIVIASAARLIEVRHFWRNRKRIAEISVPAWPMPTQNTKLVMSQAQPTGTFRPQTPMPSQKSHGTPMASPCNMTSAMPKTTHQPRGVLRSITPETISVTEWKSWPPRISGARPETGLAGSTCAFNRPPARALGEPQAALLLLGCLEIPN